MEKIDEYSISEKEFNLLQDWADNIYNTSVVIDYFVANQSEIEELNNLTPIITNLRKDADYLNAFLLISEKMIKF